ncbi:sigma-70 family RNA polymerase sigma factor [Amycolatopsis acidiphila]|uniref:Sigma-70 family RNA polymerase sigma factor n=1 Tax=Amycolatopsis acidiphila TaxID=715473 RepID=A0A558AHY4_9PSEU|nr:sigma-70 family RNA polymerase sigma factor [Amycolatopsis acidiphila]TVT23857.1 sigma-70 family RNA polymerase sigma factor [Amycolatopsis acidiphila]UIJ61167.1 sigma-70 family RNA polymerase sigma factor [Amycolatopsis acidiphila]GHG86337.1 hypothetical protein GCM10017788_59340 [Amycolatopsis acidiphila]
MTLNAETMARFAQVYRDNRGAVYAYLYGRAPEHDLAEDLTSETFVRALRAFDAYVAGDRPIRAWLFTIARNLVTDEMKSARRRRQTPLPDMLDESRFVVAEPDPAELVSAGHARDSIRSSLARLGGDQARCLVLRFFEERSIGETSTVMRRSPGAIKALQHRGIDSLRALITTGAIAP